MAVDEKTNLCNLTSCLCDFDNAKFPVIVHYCVDEEILNVSFWHIILSFE